MSLRVIDAVIISYRGPDSNDQLEGYTGKGRHTVVLGGIMGYRIIYFDEEKRVPRSRVIPLTLLFLALFLGWTMRNWEEGSGLILEAVFPVTASEAQEAAREMTRQIDEGAGVVHAFTDFCQAVFPNEMEDPY